MSFVKHQMKLPSDMAPIPFSAGGCALELLIINIYAAGTGSCSALLVKRADLMPFLVKNTSKSLD